jgi:hypothetical protein
LEQNRLFRVVAAITKLEVRMMKSLTLGFAIVAAASALAAAQDRVIIDRPAVTVPVPAPGVTIEKRDRPTVEERRNVETTGRGGCDSKTVRKEDAEGSKTVTKERCD